MYSYDTVTAAVNGLRERGFELDFNLEENCLVCQDKQYQAHEFEIVEFHRFEGNTDPADEAIVYAIQSDAGTKGILVSGYGIAAEGMSAAIAQKLAIHRSN